MQSNFRRQRGFLDVNRLLHAPTFNREGGSVLAGGAQAQMSSTGLLNQHLGAGNEMSSATQVIWGTNINASEVQGKLKNFIQSFVEEQDNAADEDESNDDRYL